MAKARAICIKTGKTFTAGDRVTIYKLDTANDEWKPIGHGYFEGVVGRCLVNFEDDECRQRQCLPEGIGAKIES